MTSVLGHIKTFAFDEQYSNWQTTDINDLFSSTLNVKAIGNSPVINNLHQAAKDANEVLIWTDCDREGEAIGHDIVEELGIEQVRRARFSAVTKQEVKHAISHMVDIDVKAVEAVKARQEIDLGIGAAYT